MERRLVSPDMRTLCLFWQFFSSSYFTSYFCDSPTIICYCFLYSDSSSCSSCLHILLLWFWYNNFNAKIKIVVDLEWFRQNLLDDILFQLKLSTIDQKTGRLNTNQKKEKYSKYLQSYVGKNGSKIICRNAVRSKMGRICLYIFLFLSFSFISNSLKQSANFYLTFALCSTPSKL